MRVLGVDPGSVKLGYGLIDVTENNMTHISSGVLRAPASWPKAKRLGYLGQLLAVVMEEEKAEECAVEDGFIGDSRATLVVAEARGMVLYLAAAHGMPATIYAPATIKLVVTGSGKVPKSVLADIVGLRLGLPVTPLEDAGDALGAAITHVLGG